MHLFIYAPSSDQNCNDYYFVVPNFIWSKMYVFLVAKCSCSITVTGTPSVAVVLTNMDVDVSCSHQRIYDDGRIKFIVLEAVLTKCTKLANG